MLVTAALFVALVIAPAVMSAVNRHHAAAAAMPAGPISPIVKLVCDPHVGGTWCEDGANGSAGTIALDIVGVSYDSFYNLCSMGYKFDLTDNYGQSLGVTGDGCGGYGDVHRPAQILSPAPPISTSTSQGILIPVLTDAAHGVSGSG